MKQALWHDRAVRDADEAAEWYAGQGGEQLELAFVDALQAAVNLLQVTPGAGSPWHDGLMEGLAAPLRFMPIRRFDDYLIYYIELPTHLQVLRIWNARRGLYALLES